MADALVAGVDRGAGRDRVGAGGVGLGRGALSNGPVWADRVVVVPELIERGLQLAGR